MTYIRPKLYVRPKPIKNSQTFLPTFTDLGLAYRCISPWKMGQVGVAITPANSLILKCNRTTEQIFLRPVSFNPTGTSILYSIGV